MFCLFGGTFDPVHLGHLHLAVQLADRYRFSEVGFFPARQNPLKEKAPGANATQRLTMLRLALADLNDPRFRLFDWEIASPAPSYTVVNVERCLKTGYRDIALVLGGEVFAGLEQWHEPRRLLQSCNVLIATRTPVEDREVEKVLLAVGIPAEKKGRRWVHGEHWVEIAAIEALPYSATSIRTAWSTYFSKGANLPGMPQGTTPSVTAYIKQNRLYAVT